MGREIWFIKFDIKSNFHQNVIFYENLVPSEMKKLFVTIDKPIYVRMCISDLSKTLIYYFHFDYISPKFVCYTEIL